MMMLLRSARLIRKCSCITDYVTPAYADDEKRKLLMMLLLILRWKITKLLIKFEECGTTFKPKEILEFLSEM